MRLLSSLLIVWLSQFGIAVWFMVGQGYDRATAGLVPWVGVVLLPLIAWLMRVGMRAQKDPWARKAGKALVQAAGLYAMGLIVPALVILNLLDLSSPFDELWWMMGCATAILAAILYRLKSPEPKSALFGVLLLLGSVASIPGWRAFVLSFFG